MLQNGNLKTIKYYWKVKHYIPKENSLIFLRKLEYIRLKKRKHRFASIHTRVCISGRYKLEWS